MFIRSKRLSLIVNVGRLKLSDQFQTLQDYAFGNWVIFKKRSNSIIIAKMLIKNKLTVFGIIIQSLKLIVQF